MARKLSLTIALAVAALTLAAAPASARVAYGITGNATLITFNTNTPGTVTQSTAITGLQGGEAVYGIDVSPITGQLFALGSTSRLYTVNTTTGAATQVGTGTFTPVISGSDFGFDVNPVTGLIRVISNAQQNIELNPTTGEAIAHPAINPALPTVGAAYSNNFAGAPSTSLFDLDSGATSLYTQSLAPDNGTLSLIGTPSFLVDPELGFDVGADGVAFAAVTSGALAALFTINLSNGSDTFVANFAGGTAAVPSLAIARPLQTSLVTATFGNEPIGAATLATPITVTNTTDNAIPVAPSVTGAQASQFAIVSDTCGTVIASGGSCTLGVIFKPTEAGALAATLSLGGVGQGNNATVPLTGTGVGPSVTLSEKAIAFGTQAIGTSTAPSTVTVTNTGNAALTVSGVSIGGDTRDFALRSQTCTAGPIAPGASCSIGVAFDPISSGAKSGHVQIADNARSTARVELSGAGASPKAVLSASSLTFPNTLTSATSPAQVVTVRNEGAAPLTISTLAFSGAGTRSFDVGSQTCTATPVPVGGTCTISLTFQPLATGALAATLHVVSNAPGTQPAVSLKGTGTARTAAAKLPARKGFGTVTVGRLSKVQTITLRSTGSAPLSVRRVRVTGGGRSQFRIASQSCTAGTLAKGRRCTVKLRFRPTSAGRKSATLTITDNVPGGGRVALSGRGR